MVTKYVKYCSHFKAPCIAETLPDVILCLQSSDLIVQTEPPCGVPITYIDAKICKAYTLSDNSCCPVWTYTFQYEGDDITVSTGLVSGDIVSFFCKDCKTDWIEEQLACNASLSWALLGNTGTIEGTDFLGTIDNVDLEFRINDTAAYKFQKPNDWTTGTPSLIFFPEINTIDTDTLTSLDGNAILSGGTLPDIFGGGPNVIDTGTLFSTAYSSSFSLIAGGYFNGITGSVKASIGGGYRNFILFGTGSAIGGGIENLIGTDGTSSHALSVNDYIAGGTFNNIVGDPTNVLYSTTGCTISGGTHHVITAQGAPLLYSTIGGGTQNVIVGDYSAIPGGLYLKVGFNTFGYQAFKATGGFVDVSLFSNLALFGDVDLWVGNVDSTARKIKLFEPNSSLTYAGTNYSSFEAQAQTADISYKLPATIGSANNILKIASVAGTIATLSWVAPSSLINAWLITGNSGTVDGTNFLGNTDDVSLTFRINDTETYKFQKPNNWASGTPSVVFFPAGGSGNVISVDTTGSLDGNGILSGGGDGSDKHQILARTYNSIVYPPQFDVIAGGTINTIAGGYSAFIGGGSQNQIHISNNSVICGGLSNLLGFNGSSTYAETDFDVIGGGRGNKIYGDGASIFRTISCIIAGGDTNLITRTGANLTYSAIGGGYTNTISGNFSAIPGGAYLKLGTNSFGFAGFHSGSTQVDVSAFSNLALFSDADLWVGNVDSTARKIKLFEPNASLTYSGTNYSSLEAQAQSADINYKLPATIGAVNDVLSISVVAGTIATLVWQTPNINIQYFSSSGTWTKPSGITNASTTRVIAIAAGGGGASGANAAAGSSVAGGGSGAGGQIKDVIFPTSFLSSSETVTIGAGGTGGAAQASSGGAAVSGNTGGSSFFGGTTVANSKLVASGGAGGTSTGAAGDTAVTGTAQFIRVGGTNGAGGAGASSPGINYGPGSGAAGAGFSSGGSLIGAGGTGGIASNAPYQGSLTVATGSGAGGLPGAANSNGGNGVASSGIFTDGILFGSGGGGGGGTQTVGRQGGNGATPGGGGGGGGNGVNSVTSSGAGGNGADGGCYVVTYF